MNKQVVAFFVATIFFNSIFFPAFSAFAQVTGYASRHVEKNLTAEEEIQEYKRYIEQLGLVNNPELRDKARFALSFIREKAFPCLYQALKKNPNPLVRSGVLDLIAGIRMNESVPTVLECFQKEKDLKVRIAYIKCLSSIGVQNTSVIKELLKNFKTEKNERTLVALIDALKQAAGRGYFSFNPNSEDNRIKHRAMAGTAFLEMLQSPRTTEFVKIYVVKALGELKEFRAIPDLTALLDHMDMGTGPLQLVAMEALKTIGTPASVQALTDCLDHPRKEVNEDAVFPLASLGTLAADALLDVLKERSKSSLSRGGAAEALGMMRDFGKSPAEVQNHIGKIYKALRTAQADADPHVAKKAEEAIEHLNENNALKKSTGKVI